ncbi:helix-turn-helix domain-containing protein [Methylobacterium sp. Leaf125]|uniref:helix-turn-helix domain-containing protein n=1 Tax=Methylobacterium sp. Leaf125 TaxID=1736265 RepID=UPI000ADA83E9|nr:helix-turn-helix domain-containing protein [Methylobacterium sp. Leaf125]
MTLQSPSNTDTALRAGGSGIDIHGALSHPTVDVVTAGLLLGIGRNAAYKAREAGDIPSFKVGGQWRVPTAPLKRLLGICSEQAAA